MDAEKFLNECEGRIRLVYEAQHQGRGKPEDKARVEGFVHAGVVMKLVSREQIQVLVDKVHLEVFDESRQARDARLERLNTLRTTDPDKYFDEPAINRRR
ncbi:hypothetical protein [Salinimonas lutimaris]|uniref:hypothetical protein n=1 Tax=Salinimonas lutimaris TaxID=914153 RepID=UPI0010C13C6B|nr:hypothetical protein [Salinimonas lutimaris]